MAKQAAADEEGELVAFWDVDEDIKPYGRDRLAKSQAEGKYRGIIVFLNDNGLFKKKRRVLDADGNLVLRQVWARDLTDEGIAFVRAANKPWFRSKRAADDPTDTTILRKHLDKLRE